jgi:hypothetical protein
MLHRNWIFYTDAPPLLEEASGNHGIAVQILHSIHERLAFVITRKFRRSISHEAIHKACTDTRLVLHPDVSGYGIKKISPLLGSILDFLIFAIWIFFYVTKKVLWIALIGGIIFFYLKL